MQMRAGGEIEADQVADERCALGAGHAHKAGDTLLQLLARLGCAVAILYLKAEGEQVAPQRIWPAAGLLAGAPAEQPGLSGRALDPGDECLEQARFAHARIADDGDQARAALLAHSAQRGL